MDVAGEWAQRIAGQFTPEEAGFAAAVGTAYAAGGSRRRDLFPGDETQPGAFGSGGLIAELPMILHALAQAGPVLLSLLGSSYLGNAVGVMGLLVALRQGHRDEQASEKQASEEDEQAIAGPPPANERQALEQSLQTLRGRLTDAGFASPRANELAYGLLEEMLSDAASAAGAAQFIGAITAVPDKPSKRERLIPRFIWHRKGA
jgi:hypothetical protein